MIDDTAATVLQSLLHHYAAQQVVCNSGQYADPVTHAPTTVAMIGDPAIREGLTSASEWFGDAAALVAALLATRDVEKLIYSLTRTDTAASLPSLLSYHRDRQAIYTIDPSADAHIPANKYRVSVAKWHADAAECLDDIIQAMPDRDEGRHA